jgi:AraC family transcriptional regulator, transcriptional activator of pobA
MNREIPTFPSAAAYNRLLGIGPPAATNFDIRRFEDNMPLVPAVMPPFRLDLYEIALKRSGGGAVKQLLHPQPADQAMLFFTYPGLVRAWDIVPDWQGFYIAFAPDFLDPLATGRSLRELPFFQAGYQSALFLSPDETVLMLDLFERIWEESRQQGPYNLLIVRGYISLLLHYSCRHMEARIGQAPTNHANPLTRAFYERLDEYVRDLLAGSTRAMGVAQFAEALGVHADTLTKVLRKDTGHGALALLRTRLMIEAKELLRHTHWDVAQIARRLGAPDPAAFSKAFHKATGQSPSAWRASA